MLKDFYANLNPQQAELNLNKKYNIQTQYTLSELHQAKNKNKK